MSTALSVRRPQRVTREDQIRAKLAKLERLAGRQITLDYNPTALYTEDPDSQGNIISGHYIDMEMEADVVHLDIRKGKLRRQLAKELRRIGRVYRKLARRVEGGQR